MLTALAHNMTYTITELTREHLECIKDALALKACVESGQIDQALNRMRNSRGRTHNIDLDTIRAVEELVLPKVELELNSWHNMGFHPEIDRSWDVYQVISHHLAWQDAVANGMVESMNSPRNVNLMMTCEYDIPYQFSSDPLPVVSLIEAD